MTAQTDRLNTALAGRYRILRHLGEGGMATVYLCEDIKHDRQVALKLLKPELAAVLGAERFVQEIKTTAALQHPHILPLFDSGAADGFLFYVMPFIDGETLRAKLDRETQLGVDDAVRIARDVADALHYAHTRGIVHRDVKPENILLHDGRPMVADFGIALAVSAAAGGRMTETGLSLGTPHYMSPEQATAEKEISARSDVYSIGSVLYEMLTGDPPHTGSSAQQVIMKIITAPAESVTKYRKAVPAHVAAAVSKALEKLPADRFESAKGFSDALQDVHFARMATDADADARRAGAHGWRAWMREPRSRGALAVIATLALISTWAVLSGGSTRDTVTSERTIRLAVVGPPDSGIISMTNSRRSESDASRNRIGSLSAPVVSPDARYLLYAVTRQTGATLMLRSLESGELRTVVDSGANGAFFSSDGSKFAFLKFNELWIASVADAKPTRLARLPEKDWSILWADWHPDGRILVTGAQGLWAVGDAGGAPTLLVANDAGSASVIVGVQVLPDGRLLIGREGGGNPRTEVRRADGTLPTEVLKGLGRVDIVDDIVFYGPRGELRASRIDLQSLTPRGEAIAVADGNVRRGRAVAVSDSFTLRLQPLYRAADGTEEALPIVASSYYRWPRLSPDGRRLAIGTARGLEVVDLDRRASWPMDGTTEPVWTPDGRYVIMFSGDRPRAALHRQVADGSRPADTLLMITDGEAYPTSVSADGAWLAYYAQRDEVGAAEGQSELTDLYFMDLKTRVSRRLTLPGAQFGARFSPNQRWIAYTSEEEGRQQVQIRDWPALAARYVVSADAGRVPVWSNDGRTLYYRRRDDMMAVTIGEAGGALTVSPPRVLFSGRYRYDPSGDQDYDIAPDGRFVLVKSRGGDRVVINVTLNWIADVKARLDAKRR